MGFISNKQSSLLDGCVINSIGLTCNAPTHVQGNNTVIERKLINPTIRSRTRSCPTWQYQQQQEHAYPNHSYRYIHGRNHESASSSNGCGVNESSNSTLIPKLCRITLALKHKANHQARHVVFDRSP